jgi:hypothetical protein
MPGSGGVCGVFGVLTVLSLVSIEWLFAILVTIVFTNRYVLGSALRLGDKRTQNDFGEDPPVWPTVAIVVPVYNEGATILKTADSFQIRRTVCVWSSSMIVQPMTRSAICERLQRLIRG